MAKVINLTYDTAIRAASWNDITFSRVFTLRGYCEKNGSDYAASLRRAIDFDHEIVGSIYTGASLIGNREQALRQNDEYRSIVASAVTLKSGDIVSIDGVLYSVRFARGNETGKTPVNSDPIKFIPVK